MSQIDPVPPAPPPYPERHDRWRQRSSGFWIGGLLILLGVYFLLQNLGLLRWLSPAILWPVILIGVGLWFVVRRLR